MASVLEGVSYINGSPQNSFVPGVMQLAAQKDVFIAGDDFKSGKRFVVRCSNIYRRALLQMMFAACCVFRGTV